MRNTTFDDQMSPLYDPMWESLHSADQKVCYCCCKVLSFAFSYYCPLCAQISEVVTEFERRIITIRADISGHLQDVIEITNLTADGDYKMDGNETDMSHSRFADAQFDAEVVAWESAPQDSRDLYGSAGKELEKAGERSHDEPSAEDSAVMSRYFPNENPNFRLTNESDLTAIHSVFTDPARRDAAIVSDKWAPVVYFIFNSSSGCGKTELARHYCYAYRSSYKFIAWINASDSCTILSSFKKCTSYIKRNHSDYYEKHFPIKEAQRHIYDAPLLTSMVMDFVIHWLESLVAPWLMVIDNMGNASELPVSIHFGSSSSDDYDEQKPSTESSKLYMMLRSLTSMLPRKCGNRILGHVLITGKKDLRSDWVQQIPSTLYSANDPNAVLAFSGELTIQSIEQLFFSYLLESEISPTIALEDAFADSGEAVRHRELLEDDIIKRGIDLVAALHMNPLAVIQALSAIREVRRSFRLHRPKLEPSPDVSDGPTNLSIPRQLALQSPPMISDYLEWMRIFNESAEQSFDNLPDYSASYKSVLTTISVVMEKIPAIRLWSVKRCLEMLAFASPHSIDLGLLQLFLRPPHTPYHVRIMGKWRLPNTSLAFSVNVRLQEAEFEIEVESVFPLSIQNNTKRFKLRVFRNYAQIRETHDAIVKLYCAAASKLRFPSAILAIAANGNAEDAVSVRRAEISTFFKELSKCPCWGKLCTTKAIHTLFGILPSEASDFISKVGTDKVYYNTDALNIYMECRPEFLRLVSPLVSLSLLNVTHSELLVPSEDRAPVKKSILGGSFATAFSLNSDQPVSDKYNRRLECSMNRCTQTALQMWLSIEGRYDYALNSTINFLKHVLKNSNAAVKAMAASTSQALAQSARLHTIASGPRRNATSDAYASKDATAICEMEYVDTSILPHALYVVSETPVDTVEFIELVEECFSRCILIPALFDKAELCCQKSLEVIGKRGKDSLDGAGSIIEASWFVYYADVLYVTSRQDKARSLYEHSLKVHRKMPRGKEDIAAVHSILKKLGRVYYEDGRYKQAQRILEESMELSRAVNAANPELLAVDLSDYVTVMCSAASDSATLELCLRLKLEELDLIKVAYGDKSLDYSQCCNSVGELHKRCNRNSFAKEWFEKSLNVLVSFGNGTHPAMTSALYNMALIYHADNQYEKAKKMYEKALEIDSMYHGKRNIETANIHDSLGILLCDQGHYDIGLDHLRTACDLYETFYGTSSRDTILSLNSLGYAYMKMGEPSLGISVYEKSLSALKERDARFVWNILKYKSVISMIFAAILL